MAFFFRRGSRVLRSPFAGPRGPSFPRWLSLGTFVTPGRVGGTPLSSAGEAIYYLTPLSFSPNFPEAGQGPGESPPLPDVDRDPSNAARFFFASWLLFPFLESPPFGPLLILTIHFPRKVSFWWKEPSWSSMTVVWLFLYWPALFFRSASESSYDE